MTATLGARRLLPTLVLLAAVFGVLALELPRPPIRVRTARVSRASLRVTVSCSGELRPPAEGELRSPEAGSVASVEVTDGAFVRAGQPLLRLASPELVTQQLAARAEQAQLEAEGRTAAAELAGGRVEAARRRRTAEQDSRLLQAGAISRETAEASTAEAAAAEARLAAATARAASLDPDQAASRLVLARARAAQLAARVAALVVRAPIDGTVFGLPRPGEPVSLGQRLGGLAQRDRPRLLVRVDAPDLPRVKEGQPLSAAFEGLPGRRFQGSLTAVDRGLRVAEGREVAEGRGELSDPEHLLPLNAGVSVEVVAGERASALLVPRGALQGTGDRRQVLVLRDGRAEARAVRVGLIGLSEVELLDGLAEGEEVLLPAATPVVPGQRVRSDAD